MSSWLSSLESRGARLEAEHVRDFGDPRAELVAARDAAVVVDLSHNALVSISGDDATVFLHAQLTNDVKALSEGAAQWTGWCTAKGRLLAAMLLMRMPSVHETHPVERYLAMLPAEIAPGILKRLSMYVLRAKVKLEDASGGFVRMGLAGPAASEILARHFGQVPHALRLIERDGAWCVPLDAERFVLLVAPEGASRLWDALSAQARPAGSEAWEWRSIHAGIPSVVTATQEAFVPQMANFDLIGAVSFRKGCYPGQEIVARTHYRGGLKRRMAVVHLDAAARPVAGESIFSTGFGEQAAGTVVNAAAAPGGGYDALVVAQIEALDRDDLRYGSPAGPALKVVSRPDREPTEAAS